MHKFKIFWELGFKKQLMFIEAFILSGIYRFMMLYMPFKYVKKRLGEPKKESAREEPLEVYRLAKEIRGLVLLACKYTPWESECLIRAMLVQHFLKRKKIATTIYLGVNKDDLNNMKAHAWLRCGEMIVTGHSQKRYFIQVAHFSNVGVVG